MKNSLFLAIIVLNIMSVSSQADCVVLLHGLARTDNSMAVLADSLAEEGYQVVNQDYPSREKTIATLAEETLPAAVAKCSEETPIHFVTHSMGGILLRAYLATHGIDNMGRAVMLGPPNQGSEVVDNFADVPGFKELNGEAGLQLGTSADSVPNQLGPVNFDVGVIAGNRSINWILSLVIPGTDDGKVAVERTKVEGMKAHIVMPVTHPMMMRNIQVIKQVKAFLKTGAFNE